jgi:nucleoid DNA-binding protein
MANKSISKTELLAELAGASELSKKQVAKVLEELASLVGKNLGKKGPGVIAIPGLCKVLVIRKPATKATTKPNPFKPGEMMEVKAKPARNVVKIRPLKALKDMV